MDRERSGLGGGGINQIVVECGAVRDASWIPVGGLDGRHGWSRYCDGHGCLVRIDELLT